jgi:hypothetical protein
MLKGWSESIVDRTESAALRMVNLWRARSASAPASVSPEHGDGEENQEPKRFLGAV